LSLSSLLLTSLTLTSVIFIFFASLESLPFIIPDYDAPAPDFPAYCLLVLDGLSLIGVVDDAKHRGPTSAQAARRDAERFNFRFQFGQVAFHAETYFLEHICAHFHY
jgi:hypothetical protein